MTTEAKKFEELSGSQLYELMKLRVDIFVVEQECAYEELDNFDQVATHILGYSQNELVAYARVLPPDTVYTQSSIGRVAVKKEARNMGFGRILFKAALEEAQRLYSGQEIKIQAQIYLEEFYSSFDFKTISEPYPDWGIWHVDMILEAS
ncbi:putative acyltransferase [Owenweeksia hongkongensis DSM 17368]|uniref:Putative acyltransferase n=1 Tax=Owenweeksia hongkongensis (strain DSM 17368 / CIP 108786 / JCM 12287 / NRRL B-23963 / UST20020801) TaxID=926562 RepID=G8R5G8_OWEHD|nr:GNAT family N-acetyltransferase [Owenweeksia hongkongensis]AEV33242.1 putative acyltransferase [Owenweeksia hongkongensis DSM 17368]